MTQNFANAARANLSDGISDQDLSLTITGGGALYPVADTDANAIGPTRGWFKLVLQDDSGIEIVYCRTHAAGSNTFSNLLRGQEGTVARSFAALSIVGLRALASDYTKFNSAAESVDRLGPMQDLSILPMLKFLATQISVNAWGVRALHEQAQQEGEITIRNRGVVSGCSVTRSQTATRNLNIEGGRCFANGRSYSVATAANAASVPSNLGVGAEVVRAYLSADGQDVWHFAVTAIGQAVPDDAIVLYVITIPAGNTDATDPQLAAVTFTDVRRLEPLFPRVLDSPATAPVPINTLRSSDYRLDFDVVSADGAPACPADIIVASRATNGFTINLASAADRVAVRWRASRLNN